MSSERSVLRRLSSSGLLVGLKAGREPVREQMEQRKYYGEL